MSKPSYSIRLATKEDIELIRSLCFRVWPQTYSSIISSEQIDYMLDKMYSPLSLAQQMDEGAHFNLLYNLTQPVGFASYQVITLLIANYISYMSQSVNKAKVADAS